MIKIAIFMTLAGIVHVLKEIPHIWAHNFKYECRFKWMNNSRWFTDSSPRSNRTWYNIIFADAYHFFSNFIKLFISIVVVVVWYFNITIYIKPDIYNLLALLCWSVSRYLTFHLFIKEI